MVLILFFVFVGCILGTLLVEATLMKNAKRGVSAMIVGGGGMLAAYIFINHSAILGIDCYHVGNLNFNTKCIDPTFYKGFFAIFALFALIGVVSLFGEKKINTKQD